jgi:hypothetical protein
MEDWRKSMKPITSIPSNTNSLRPTSVSQPQATPTCSTSTAPTAQPSSATAVSSTPSQLKASLTSQATTVEVQGRWIVDCIDKMNKNNIKYINPETKAADEWKQHILDLNNISLFPTTRST